MKHRLFLAIPIPANFRQEVLKVSKVSEVSEAIRWVPYENYHITISFLGHVEEEKIPTIAQIGDEIAKRTPPFTLEFDKITLAPLRKSPRMIWALLQKNDAFTNLVREVEESLIKNNLSPKRTHSPTPHITLARLNKSIKYKVSSIKEFSLHSLYLPLYTNILISSFTLYESKLSPKGSLYIPLQHFHFHN